VEPSGYREQDRAAGPLERVGGALVRMAGELAADRQATIRGITANPAGAPGRDRALAALAPGAWVEQALLWVGWRLMARHTVFGPNS
jgi:hypothetical protein